MNDSTIYYFGDLQQTYLVTAVQDTLESSSDSSGAVLATFFSHAPVEILPVVRHPANDHWFIYVLLFLSLGVAVIWYNIPERLSSIFSLSLKTIMGRSAEKGFAGPGIGVSVFFLLNSLITMSFLALYTCKHLVFKEYFTGTNEVQMLASLALVLGLFSFVKLVLIRLSGAVFKTTEMAKKQQIIYLNSYNASGVLLLPLLFVLMIMPGNNILYLILFLMAIMFVYRWVQTIAIGINITHFNTFHLILYLCTLEIIPVVVLVKIFM